MKDTLYDDAQAIGGMFHAESGLDVRYYDDAIKIKLGQESIILPRKIIPRVIFFMSGGK